MGKLPYNPSVYIILVNYNGLNDTLDCLNSLSKINYKNYQVIIVDNNSKQSIDIIQNEYPNYLIIKSQKNLGFAGANNLGIKVARDNGADYICLLNNDTIVDPNFLNPLVNCLENDDSVGIVGGKILYYDSPNDVWFIGGKIDWKKCHTSHLKKDVKCNQLIECDYITGCLMLFRESLIDEIGYMNEEYFLYYEETDFNLKAKQKGYKLVCVPESIIYHKVSASTGGIYSPIMNYYFFRSKVIFFRKFRAHIENRIIAQIYQIMFYGYRIIDVIFNCKSRNKINNVKSIIKGIKDGYNYEIY